MRLFAKHGVTGTAIEAVPGGYRITAEPPTLDLLGFRDQVRRAAGLDRDPEAELHALRDALALWQGALLANVRSEVLHRDEVPRLAEERLRAVERVCDLLLGLGRCGEALVDLWTATRVYPGHERFHEQLIEALYRTGRQSQALAEYRRVKGFLLEELGVDPSPSLRRLELSILRGEDLGSAGPDASRVIRGETVPLPAAAAAAPASSVAVPVTTPAAAVPAGGASAVAPAGGAALAPAAVSGVGPVPAVPHFTGRTAEAAALAARLTGPAAASTPRTTGRSPSWCPARPASASRRSPSTSPGSSGTPSPPGSCSSG